MDTAKKKGIVGAATVAGMGLCFLALYYSGERLGEEMHGPSKIAGAPDGTIWVSSHGGLHHFTAAGERTGVVALSALKLGPVVSELLPLSDGSLVLAEAEPSAAYRCSPSESKCTSITAGIGAAVGPTAHALMVAADEKRGRFYISDNANHRLILVDFEGKVRDVTKPLRVLHPNELVLDRPGELVVVDTDHRRLVRIGVRRDAFGPDLWEMKTDSRLVRPSRILPMDFARSPDGGWWVLIARPGMKDGDVILFGADGKARRRIDLGPDSDPTQIAAVPAGLLVADPTRATLMRVAPDGTVAGPWGDAAFQSELEGMRTTRSLWRAARFAAQFLIVAIPLAGIVVLWRMGERLPAQPLLAVPASPTPVERGIHWLEVRPELSRRARKTSIALAVLIWSALAASVWFIRPLLGVARDVDVVLIPLLALWALMPLPLLRMSRVWWMRLGTDGRRFFLDDGKGKVEEYSFGDLVTSTGHQLLAGRRLISLRTGMRSLYPEDELRGFIFARIPPSGRVDPLTFLRRAMDRGSREIWLIWILAAVGAVFFLLPTVFPGLVDYFRNIAMQLLGLR